jgi:hypothetical protein
MQLATKEAECEICSYTASLSSCDECEALVCQDCGTNGTVTGAGETFQCEECYS